MYNIWLYSFRRNLFKNFFWRTGFATIILNHIKYYISHNFISMKLNSIQLAIKNVLHSLVQYRICLLAI